MTRSLSLVGNWGQSLPARAGKKIIRFLRRQLMDIRQGGLPVLLRKTRTFTVMALTMLVVLSVRVLRPLVLIRFGPLNSKRLGHFTVNTEMYLCQRDAGMDRPRTFDIFYYNLPVSNQQLKKMWDRTLRVSRFAHPVDRLNHLLPGYEAHVIPTPSDRDIHGLLRRTRVHLSFTPEEERLGRVALGKLGIPDGAPFVCFHARDSAYLDAVFTRRNWGYHDYRDANIKNFIPAAEELVRRGYYAIRMGAVVKEALNTSNPKIIDYATKYRTDFLDIFLGAKCHFYFGASGGFYGVPMIFKHPLAIVDTVPLEYALTWLSNGLFIPKKLWLREERRFLTFGEVFNSGVGRFLRSEQYEQLGVEVVGNTPEEITALTVEMDERLKGTWQTTKEDKELQRRFWSLFKPSELHGIFVSHIGAEFLRQNRELLD